MRAMTMHVSAMPIQPGPFRAALVVEDDPASRELACAVLERAGAQVTAVASGVEAIDAWRAGAYDIVFMDNHMPRMNGLEATQHIRREERAAQRAKTPIIAITASGLPEELQACLDAGMDAFLLKPFRLHALVALLDEWAPRRQAS